MNKAASTSLPNIILIGLMGCGKTTIGKELHRETAHLTIDTANLHIHEIAFGILESARVFRSRRQ